MTRYYFDTGIFVTPVLRNRDDMVLAWCRGWLERMSRGEIETVTSRLTWDEVTHVVGSVAPSGKNAYEHTRAAAAGTALLQQAGLQFVDVDDDVLARAQSLLLGHAVRPRDCIHAASALVRADGRFVTLDNKLAASAGALGLDVYNLARKN